MGFSQKIAETALLRSGRHCCICRKFCGFKIELHHIVPTSEGGEDTFENCIPLCFNCHADVMAYNPKHPKGRKYTASELRAHRDNWYRLIDAIGERVRVEEDAESSIPTQIAASDSDGADYIHETSEKFTQELAALNEELELAIRERESARRLGLEGAMRAAEIAVESLRERVQILQRRVEITAKGYEFWDRLGFQIACEACYFHFNWYYFSYNQETGEFVSCDDLVVRIPIEAQKALKAAADMCLFERFLVCEAMEDPIEVFCEGQGDHEVIEKSTYFLFGAFSQDEYEIFYIDQWSENYF